MITINVRIDRLELRSCNARLGIEGKHETCEIILWHQPLNLAGVPETCHAVAYWVRHKDGFDLRFVGLRPFETDRLTFWHLAELGQRFVEKFLAVEDGG